MLESVLNFKAFGVSDSLGERIRIFPVENVEHVFQNWFRVSVPSPSNSLINA